MIMQKPEPLERWIFLNLARDFGGHEVMLLRWMDEVAARGDIATCLICYKHTRLEHEARSRHAEIVAISRLPVGKLGDLLTLIRILSHLLVRRLFGARIVVVAEGSLFSQRLGLYACRISGLFTALYVPLLGRFSSMGYSDADRLEMKAKRFYVRLPDAWVCVSKMQAIEFLDWSKTQKPTFVLPNTVSHEIEDAADFQVPRPVRWHTPTRVLVFGRLDAAQKGLDLLLDFLAESTISKETLSISFVGSGPYESSLQDAIRNQPGLAEVIKILPWGDPLQTYAEHDVLLIASRFEGVPLVMLEAMALGLPVVSSDLPGTRAYLHSSCLFPVGDIRSAFRIVQHIAKRHHAACRVAARNREVFRRMGSGAAFARHVGLLTQSIRDAAGDSPKLRR